MFGVGPQELLIVGLLALLLLGPGKLAGVARDLGGFVWKARVSIEEFKSDLGIDEAQDGTHRDREPERRKLGPSKRPGNTQEEGEAREPDKGGEGYQKQAEEDRGLEEDRRSTPVSLSEGSGERTDGEDRWDT